MILLYALNKVLDVFAKLPLLKQANKLVGMALGLVQGILLVWLFFALVTVISGTEFGQTMFRYINESKLLSFLYTNNIPMNFITKTAAPDALPPANDASPNRSYAARFCGSFNISKALFTSLNFSSKRRP